MVSRAVLTQCGTCHYTETLDCTSGGLLILTRKFRVKSGVIRHQSCGGAIRLWTGREQGFRLRGVI